MNKIIIEHYINYLKAHNVFPKMFNPYNESEIKNIAPTLTTNCGHYDSSATVLITEEEDVNKDKE